MTNNRRDFLKTSGGALAATTLAGFNISRLSADPSDQITLGCIGMGGHGTNYNLPNFLKLPDVRVLAVCDVFSDKMNTAKSKVDAHYGNADCRTYPDFRNLLAADDIDAVVISTPDHWHVLMSAMAARAGKHVFCEKPTLTIAEGQDLIRIIRDSGVIYQGGIEDRSVPQYHRMAELVRNGALGKLQRIEVTLPEGDLFPKEESVPVPKGLDYDMWLGPAPFSPYSPTKLGRQEWRNQFDYSGGKFTDWGAHLMDTAQVAIGEEHGGPLEVEGTGTFPVDALSNTATTFDLTYRYNDDVIMSVKSGGTGIRFIGKDGWVGNESWRSNLEASSPDILDAVYDDVSNKMYPRPLGEHAAFIEGIKSEKMPYYSPTDIHRLSTAMHIGNIAMLLERKLKWDPVREEFTDDSEANAMRSRPMRAPWSLG